MVLSWLVLAGLPVLTLQMVSGFWQTARRADNPEKSEMFGKGCLKTCRLYCAWTNVY